MAPPGTPPRRAPSLSSPPCQTPQASGFLLAPKLCLTRFGTRVPRPSKTNARQKARPASPLKATSRQKARPPSQPLGSNKPPESQATQSQPLGSNKPAESQATQSQPLGSNKPAESQANTATRQAPEPCETKSPDSQTHAAIPGKLWQEQQAKAKAQTKRLLPSSKARALATTGQTKEQDDEYELGEEDAIAPPAQVGKATLMKRLARLCSPREDGTYKIPEDVIKTYRNLETRDQVYRSFEKCGCDPVCLPRLRYVVDTCMLFRLMSK